jgi:eukaryotic-like serine/threonine-protein kinase
VDIETVTSGSRLGPYEIVSRIGAGGMGEVWRAHDTRLGRSVAIKILPPQFANNAQLKVRFEREARAISQLTHPHICTLYDVGEDGGTGYLVMELLEGESLAERLARGPLELHEVLRYGQQVAEALDRAHRQQVVHRDLKPANVMITRAGAKLLDFGLAKMASSENVDAAAMTQQLDERTPLTAEGTIVGTFQYMAPEQLEGGEVDARTDIFALGALLYEMTTGRRAFEGKTRTSVIAAILRGNPDPLVQVQPLTPPALEHVISRSLAKDPEDRWQSAADVAAHLRWISESGSQAGIAAPVVEKRKRRERLWIAVAALLALVAAALGATLLRRQAPIAQTVRAEIVAPGDMRYDIATEDSASLTISPDGKWITFALDEPGEQESLWIRSTATGGVRKLISGSFRFPFWSPDSRQLAYFAGTRLLRIPVGGGPAVTICSVREPRGGTWNADGTIVFAPHWRGELHRVPASGGTSQPLTKIDQKSGETTHRYPVFLPDGRHYVFLAGTHLDDAASEKNALYLGSLDSQERKLLVRARSNAAFAAGHLFYARDNHLLAQRLSLDTRSLEGDPRRVSDSVAYDPGFFRAVFAVSGEGTVVLHPRVAGGTQRINVRQRDGKQLASFHLGTGLIAMGSAYSVRLSPDGRFAAVSIADPTDIWILDLQRGTRRRLTHHPLNDYEPVWSPDGRRIAYSSDRNVKPDLFVRNADGTGEEEQLYASPELKVPNSWSPDGRYLVFDATLEGDPERNPDLYFYDLQAKRATRLTSTPSEEWGARVSPDGRFLSYVSDETGRYELYVTSFPNPGPRVQVSRDATAYLGVWTRNGTEIIYPVSDGTITAVKITVVNGQIDASPPVALFKVDADALDVSADGARFVTLERQRGPQIPLTLITNWR